MFYFRDLYPVGKHFFALTSVDGSKPHKPVGCSVLDIPTAFAFFGQDPAKTCSRVTAAVYNLVNKWNEANARKSSVRKPFLYKIPIRTSQKMQSIQNFFYSSSGKTEATTLTTRFCPVIKQSENQTWNWQLTTDQDESENTEAQIASKKSSHLNWFSTFLTGDLCETLLSSEAADSFHAVCKMCILL